MIARWLHSLFCCRCGAAGRNKKSRVQRHENASMHYADITAALIKSGQSPARVAEILKVRRATVSQVIHGKATSKRIALHISNTIGIPVEKIWPGQYRKSRKTA